VLDRPPFGKACPAISSALSRSRTGWEKTFQAVAGAGASVAWIIQVPYAAASRCALQCTARRIWKPSKQVLDGRRLQRNNGGPDNDITIGARAHCVRAHHRPDAILVAWRERQGDKASKYSARRGL
jgi:hypothetical protein